METGQKKWYAVYTKPRNEKKIANTLTTKGIENYCPLYITERQWSDRKKKVEVPLFSSYIFVHVDKKDYYEALNTKGILKYVSFSGEAVVIQDKQIEIIKQILTEKIEFELSIRTFKKGEKVKIQKGILNGLEGEIVTIDGKENFLIRIENIAYSLLLKIEKSALVKI